MTPPSQNPHLIYMFHLQLTLFFFLLPLQLKRREELLLPQAQTLAPREHPTSSPSPQGL